MELSKLLSLAESYVRDRTATDFLTALRCCSSVDLSFVPVKLFETMIKIYYSAAKKITLWRLDGMRLHLLFCAHSFVSCPGQM